MKYYINYSDEAFKKQQDFAIKMARLIGDFDETISYDKNDIDSTFYQENQHILNQKRGGGYWLWKPYFIVKSLENMNDGDYLFYSDSGAFFLKSVNILINELEKYNQDIMAFELPLIEKQWSKRELLLNMKCDKDYYTESNQILASFQLIKKTNFSVRFYKELLLNSIKEENITDYYNPKIKQKDNYIDHRHDQSIFSLMYKKYKLRPYKDPSQRGEFPRNYAGCPIDVNFTDGCIHVLNNGRQYRTYRYTEKYSNVLFHNRCGRPVQAFLKHLLRKWLYKIGLYKGLF